MRPCGVPMIGAKTAVLLCSDLQDPPEIASGMVTSLLERLELDAVLAVKRPSVGGPLLRQARRMDHRDLGLSSRRRWCRADFVASAATGRRGSITPRASKPAPI